MHRPNIVLIMSDQHNPHVMGCAGDPYVRTPNLDRLAAEGVLFENAYCAHPLCVPSRMAFMTGRYPLDLGIWTNAGILSSDVPTFAHALNAAGYETVLCGRMHFVGPDQNHGFAQRLVGDISGARTGGDMRTLFEGVWSWKANRQTADTLRDDAVGPGKATYEVYDADVVARACRWIEDRAAAGERDVPFLLVVGFLLPHNPYVCTRSLFEEYLETLPPPVPYETDDEHPAVIELKRTRGMHTVTLEQQRRARAAYYGLTTTLDANVGRILDALDASGLRDSTHVVYTSDHGDLCGEHGLWWKDSFYEGSVGVPLIWVPPQAGVRGWRVRAPASLLDVSASMVDLAGAPELPGARGRSLRPYFLEGGISSGAPDREVFAETFAGGRPGRMIRLGRWKLCMWDGWERVQLFDLEEDPHETCDLGAAPEFAEVRRDLTARLRREWDPENVRTRHALRMAEQDLVFRTGTPQGRVISERWPFPTGVNYRES